MLTKFFKRDEKGITGLETAIILIAFVVVAAVFAYTTLSAGLFSTQKSQEAVYAGLREARSTLEPKGGVIAVANTIGDSGTIGQVKFTVSSVLGGEPVDFTPPTANTTPTAPTRWSSPMLTRTKRRMTSTGPLPSWGARMLTTCWSRTRSSRLSLATLTTVPVAATSLTPFLPPTCQ